MHNNKKREVKYKWSLNNRWGGFWESEFKYLGALITDNNEVGKEIKQWLNLGNSCYYSI